MIKAPPKANISSALELTPLIDIVFIVVVFLLLTANARLLSVPVDIPASDDAVATVASPEHVISVAIKETSPRFAIGETRYDDWAQLKAAIVTEVAQHSDYRLLIASDRLAPAEDLIQLLAFLNAQHITNTHILMEEVTP